MPASRRQKSVSGPPGEVSARAGQPPVRPRAFRKIAHRCAPLVASIGYARKVRPVCQPYRRSRRHPGCTRRKKRRPEAAGEVPSTVLMHGERASHEGRGRPWRPARPRARPRPTWPPGLDRGEGDQTGKHRERRHRAVRIICRYILMRAMSIRRVNPTDFDGHPNSQEKPEIAPVDRLRVTTKRGDSTCP